MKSPLRRLLLATVLLALVPLAAPVVLTEQAPAESRSKRAIELEDIIAWKTIGATTLSNDGQWFAYRVAPQEGDAELIVRNVATGKATTFDLGETGGGAGGGFGGGGAIQFSDDSKWIVFNTSPSRAEAQRLRRQRRLVQGSTSVVNLASGEKKDYPRIRRSAFNGEAATHLALHRSTTQPRARHRLQPQGLPQRHLVLHRAQPPL